MKQATQQPPTNKSTAVALSPEDLAMVLLVRDTPGSSRPVPTLTVPELRQQATLLAGLGIRAVKIFASSTRRHPQRAPWKTPADLMTQAITEIKAAAPAMTVMTETCLCSYTPAGECYLPGPGGKADVPATIAALADQAVAQADAGADIVGPAAMIPGTVRAARAALDETGHAATGIMPHLILDSRLYDVYRAAMGATPASGLTTDILIGLRAACAVPLAPFSVSGNTRGSRRRTGATGGCLPRCSPCSSEPAQTRSSPTPPPTSQDPSASGQQARGSHPGSRPRPAPAAGPPARPPPQRGQFPLPSPSRAAAHQAT